MFVYRDEGPLLSLLKGGRGVLRGGVEFDCLDGGKSFTLTVSRCSPIIRAGSRIHLYSISSCMILGIRRYDALGWSLRIYSEHETILPHFNLRCSQSHGIQRVIISGMNEVHSEEYGLSAIVLYLLIDGGGVNDSRLTSSGS